MNLASNSIIPTPEPTSEILEYQSIKNPQTSFPYYRQPIISTPEAAQKCPGATYIRKDIRSTLDTTTPGFPFFLFPFACICKQDEMR